LPFGAAAAKGNARAALFGTLGPGLIGTGSLWHAYRTTVRLSIGQYTAGTVQPATQERWS